MCRVYRSQNRLYAFGDICWLCSYLKHRLNDVHLHDQLLFSAKMLAQPSGKVNIEILNGIYVTRQCSSSSSSIIITRVKNTSLFIVFYFIITSICIDRAPPLWFMARARKWPICDKRWALRSTPYFVYAISIAWIHECISWFIGYMVSAIKIEYGLRNYRKRNGVAHASTTAI